MAAKDVAIYNIAVSLGLLLNVPLLGVNRILLPVAAGLHSEDKEEELLVTYKSVSRWCMKRTPPRHLPGFGLMISQTYCPSFR